MRFVLVDYMHLAHKCIVVPPMGTTIKLNGEVKYIVTTIPSVTIKSIYGYSQRGSNYIGVFFEGGNLLRKEYFEKHNIHYKGNRRGTAPALVEGVKWTKRLLRDGEVSTYQESGYEADDLIYSQIKVIQENYPKAKIDIITCDSDLLPLVDENISVYMKANRTYSEEGSPTINHYFQVTPGSWGDFFSYSSNYKSYNIPFNSVLLHKLIKGDKSDNVPMALKGYGPKKYNDLVEKLIQEGVEFSEVFRYGVEFGEVITPILEPYIGAEGVAQLKINYDGLGLMDVPGQPMATQIQVGKLVPSVQRLGIALRV